MRRMVYALLSNILLLTGTRMISYGVTMNGIPTMGPGVKASMGENGFPDLDVVSPIVKPVEKYSFKQMKADIQALQQTYEDKMTANVIGTSKDGRNIYDIILGSPQAEKQILMQGAIHAREYAAPLLMMSQLKYAPAGYDTGHYDARKTGGMLKEVVIHFIPMTNPDGMTLSQFGMDVIRLEELKQAIRGYYDRDTQTSRTTDTFEVYLMKQKASATGVGLSYNFSAGWNELSTKLMAPSFTSYKGPSLFSEPETQALERLTRQYPWAITINYHSQGEVIYWTTSENGAKMVSSTLADFIFVMTDYRVDNSDGKGGSKNWIQSRSEVAPGVTIEVGKTPCPVPSEEFAAVWKQNKDVWAQVSDYVIRRIQPALR